MSIGLRLKEERERLGFTQPVFAGLAGTTKKSQIDYEKDLTQPKAGYLAVIANVGADVQYIITGQRSSAALPADEAFMLEKIRQASLETRNKLLMLLLGGSEMPTGVVSNQDNTVNGQQIGDNNEQTNSFGSTQNSTVKIKKLRKGTIVGIKNE